MTILPTTVVHTTIFALFRTPASTGHAYQRARAGAPTHAHVVASRAHPLRGRMVFPHARTRFARGIYAHTYTHTHEGLLVSTKLFGIENQSIT